MRIYKTRPFARWARQEGLRDSALAAAAAEIQAGLIDAELGGHVVKKRVALPGRGKRSGARTLLAYQRDDRFFFLYGFAKNEKDNIDERELQALKRLSGILLGWEPAQLRLAVAAGRLIEVNNDG
ncbi:type II toxin-antitoxin system RelE/ParE family toxin [Bordetella genomosp. 13]|uniref:type II toxin-antitoxin system RelE/ParE family toxin n=1 Tax=Bordetella genomosp. 13 TaxID=463040 RepID=UPI0011A255D8|nr:type II toxin-antitoxin system RelE/ParE family toxin [Bordetella genomosp. 13]